MTTNTPSRNQPDPSTVPSGLNKTDPSLYTTLCHLSSQIGKIEKMLAKIGDTNNGDSASGITNILNALGILEDTIDSLDTAHVNFARSALVSLYGKLEEILNETGHESLKKIKNTRARIQSLLPEENT